MESAHYQQLFLFAAKAGSLEGYLFKRRKVEPLDNWMENIGRMYQELPASVRREIDPLLAPVLKKTLEYGDKVLESRFKEKLRQMLLVSSAGI